MYTILTIDDDLIDDTVEKIKKQEIELIDILVGKDYTILRCSKKRLCCFISVIAKLLVSSLEIFYFIYICFRCRVLYGLAIYIFYIIILSILISLIYYIGGIDENRVELMCPMPSEYMKLFNENIENIEKDLKDKE